jgi:glycosyltransferase involved in cell wall biosynthesis
MTGERPLRIAYLVQQFPPEIGAGPARVLELARRWQQAGAAVTVITALPSRQLPGMPAGAVHPAYRGRHFLEEQHEGIRVLRSWVYSSPRGGFARTLANNASFLATSVAHALARLGAVDVLIASSPPFFPHLAGALVAGARRLPLVLELRDLWPDYLVQLGVLRDGAAPTRALFALERALLRRARAVAVVTESFRTRALAKGADPTRTAVLPNGVEPRAYYRAVEPPPLPSLARERGEFIAGYLGTFGAGQALGVMVDVATILAREAPAIRLVLAGSGPDRANVAALAAAAALPNLALEPAIPRAQTRAFYNACDVCLVPLAPVPVFQETVPSKIFEIMACERPVLASTGGETRRIIDESGCGLAVPPGDARAIADALRQLHARPAAERAAMGARGRGHVLAHYDRDAVADRYLDLLRDVTGITRPLAVAGRPAP